MPLYHALPTKLFIIKPSNEIVNNSNVLQNDNDFHFTIEANQHWQGWLKLAINSDAAADFKCGWTYPVGCSIWWGDADIWNKDATGINFADAVIVKQTSGYCGLLMFVDINNGATTGTIQLQWAQNTAHGSDTIVLSNSTLELTFG